MSAVGRERRHCDRWLPINFRYAPFATEVTRRRKMLRRAKSGSDLLQWPYRSNRDVDFAASRPGDDTGAPVA